ncbi:MAG: hypothetical protein JWQ99_1617 [Blastococcus sp.]|jgi:hypothetical protein|nr:hypothetical protein [Blastococcus sp.]
MVLVIALVGAATLLSALALVAGRRGRGQNPSVNPAESGPALDGRGAATRDTWTFGGGGGLP